MIARDFIQGLAFHAALAPNRPAVITLDAVVSYGRLWSGIQSLAARITGMRLKPDTRVGLAIPNPVGHVTAFCALHLAGYPSLSLEVAQLPTLQPGLVDLLLTNVDVPEAPCEIIRIEDAWFEDDCDFPAAEVDSDAIARLVLSSGTTGVPKIIALTRQAVAERVATYAVRLSKPSWERIVCGPGLSTNYGYSFTITALWLGRTICFTAPHYTREMIVSYQADALVASTQQISAMVEAQEQNPLRLDTLKVVHIGGSIAYPPLLTRIRLLVCNNVLCGYGSTEAGTVAYAPVEYVHGASGAVGVVAPWVKIDTVDQARHSLGGSAGELRIRALGQGRRIKVEPDGSYAMEPDDWFYPGDEGMVEASGLIFVTGRVNEIINKGGVKVAPDRIEQKARELPAIADAAAIGMLDEIGIERIWLAVVMKPSAVLRAEEICEFIGAQMPQFIPDRIIEVPEIPRNRLGKIARETLREHLSKWSGPVG